jgi:Ca-activated chloride channel family protein
LLPLSYVWLLRRRSSEAVRYSSMNLVRAAAQRNWRRHVLPALLMLACALLLLASARPMARVPLPWAKSSIMLAMDVSLSMSETDVKPNRLAAAQETATQSIHASGAGLLQISRDHSAQVRPPYHGRRYPRGRKDGR